MDTTKKRPLLNKKKNQLFNTTIINAHYDKTNNTIIYMTKNETQIVVPQITQQLYLPVSGSK